MTAARARRQPDDPGPARLRVQRHGYRRVWRGSLFSTFLSPILFLAAMGVGLGTFVDQSGERTRSAGSAYAAFLAPGLLAGQAMQTAGFESTWPIMGGIIWDRTFCGMLATPITVPGIILGQLGWIALPAGARGDGVLRRDGRLRPGRIAARRPGNPGRRPDRARVRRPDLRLLGDPEERPGVQRPVPVRAHPDVPVQRDVLPDRPAAGAAPARSRRSCRFTTAWPSPATWSSATRPTGATSSSTSSCSSPTSSSGSRPAS